MNKTGESLKN